MQAQASNSIRSLQLHHHQLGPVVDTQGEDAVAQPRDTTIWVPSWVNRPASYLGNSPWPGAASPPIPGSRTWPRGRGRQRPGPPGGRRSCPSAPAGGTAAPCTPVPPVPDRTAGCPPPGRCPASNSPYKTLGSYTPARVMYAPSRSRVANRFSSTVTPPRPPAPASGRRSPPRRAGPRGCRAQSKVGAIWAARVPKEIPHLQIGAAGVHQIPGEHNEVRVFRFQQVQQILVVRAKLGVVQVGDLGNAEAGEGGGKLLAFHRQVG